MTTTVGLTGPVWAETPQSRGDLVEPSLQYWAGKHTESRKSRKAAGKKPLVSAELASTFWHLQAHPRLLWQLLGTRSKLFSGRSQQHPSRGELEQHSEACRAWRTASNRWRGAPRRHGWRWPAGGTSRQSLTGGGSIPLYLTNEAVAAPASYMTPCIP